MTGPDDAVAATAAKATQRSDRYWIAVVARAAIALIAAAVVTFNPDHSPALGFAVFSAFALATGAVLVAGGFAWSEPRVRGFVIAQGAIGIAAGIVAAILVGGGLPFLIFLVTSWAAVTGFIELFLGLRSRGRSTLSRDWLLVGILTALLAIGLLLVPPGLNQPFGGIEQIEGALTASVVVVGAFGAYTAVLGVFLAIAGLSMKWTRQDPPVSHSPKGSN